MTTFDHVRPAHPNPPRAAYLRDKDVRGKGAKPTVRNALLRYFALLLLLARQQDQQQQPPPHAPQPPPQRQQPPLTQPQQGGQQQQGGQEGALSVEDLAAWLRDECCKVLGLSVSGGAGGGAGEEGGEGAAQPQLGSSESEGALEGLTAALLMLPVSG